MTPQPLPMPDPQQAPAWRAAAETSRQQFPHMVDRAAYFDGMADWHEGKRETQPRVSGLREAA